MSNNFLENKILEYVPNSQWTKAGPQASIGKATQNLVQSWFEAEQTGFARVSK